MKKIIIDDINIEKTKIFECDEITSLLNILLNNNNLSNIKVCNSDSELIARFSRDEKIYINPKRMIAYSFLEISKNDEYKNKIEIINLRILQILLHEIEHINQFIDYNPFFALCEKQEDSWKKLKKYNKREYLCNPLERIAEIESNKLLLEFIDKNSNCSFCFDIKNNIYNNMLYGYFIDDYEYPMNYFFENKVPFFKIDEDKMTIGEKIEKKYYNDIKKLIVRRQ